MQEFENRKLVATYEYRNSLGELLYQVLRFEPKEFRQRRPDGDGWSWNLAGIERTLYRLPELISSLRSEVIYVTEGEKDCETLRGLGLTSTTAGGCGSKWTQYMLCCMAARDVVVLADNDAPGRVYADEVCVSLLKMVHRVRNVLLPGLGPHGDVTDWINSGHTKEDFLAVCRHWPRFSDNWPDIFRFLHQASISLQFERDAHCLRIPKS